MRVRPLILLAVIALVVGCEKAPEEPKELPEVYTMTDHSYMKDQEFRKSLSDRRKAREGVLIRREELLERRAQLDEGSPERAEVEREIEILNDETERLRLEALAIARDRINRAIADTKLVEEGKAKAK